MNETRFTGSLWIAAGIALAAGLALTARTAGRLGEARERLDRKIEEVAAIRAIEERAAPYRAAQEAFARLAPPPGGELPELIAREFDPHKPDDAPEFRRESAPGWAIRQREIVFSDVPFEKVGRFLQAAESLRPPWRLVKGMLRPSAGTAGAGQCVLLLEALERK